MSDKKNDLSKPWLSLARMPASSSHLFDNLRIYWSTPRPELPLEARLLSWPRLHPQLSGTSLELGCFVKYLGDRTDLRFSLFLYPEAFTEWELLRKAVNSFYEGLHKLVQLLMAETIWSGSFPRISGMNLLGWAKVMLLSLYDIQPLKCHWEDSQVRRKLLKFWNKGITVRVPFLVDPAGNCLMRIWAETWGSWTSWEAARNCLMKGKWNTPLLRKESSL